MKKIKYFLVLIIYIGLLTACTENILEEDNQLRDFTETRANVAPDLYSKASTISLANELNSFSLTETNGISTVGGYYWNQTYSNTKFTTTNFTFSHTGGTVSGYNYWDGFTVSNVADTHNYGIPGDPGIPAHSEGWIPHQWGCMAIPSNTTNVTPFLVGYWGYYMLDNQNTITTNITFGENKYSNWVKLGNNSQTHMVNKITVAIHPWPYYGILYGDGFARAFYSGDHFDLIVYGVKANGKFVTNGNSVKSITYKMADYTGSSLVMPTAWTDVNIDFGEPIKYLVFQLSSTDESGYGSNTAVYFCLKDIVMQ